MRTRAGRFVVILVVVVLTSDWWVPTDPIAWAPIGTAAIWAWLLAMGAKIYKEVFDAVS